jgi:hypothetical protein
MLRYNKIMNKKYLIDIIFQLGVILVAYSFFIDCHSFFAEEKSLLPSLRVCQENYFGFLGAILISIALNLFIRRK